MNALRNVLRVAALALFATSASAAVDDDMKSLASKSGCLTCHSIESGAPGPNGMASIGPA
jgi:cytochrome c